MQMQRVVQHIDDGHVTAEDCRLLGLDSKVSVSYTHTHTHKQTHSRFPEESNTGFCASTLYCES